MFFSAAYLYSYISECDSKIQELCWTYCTSCPHLHECMLCTFLFEPSTQNFLFAPSTLCSFLHTSQPIWRLIVVVGSTIPIKRLRVKTLNPSLDVYIWKMHVNILSLGSVNAICMELRASTFTTIFEGYNLPSSHLTCLCLPFNKWVNFPITIDLSTLPCIWSIYTFWCQFLRNTQRQRSFFLDKLTNALF